MCFRTGSVWISFERYKTSTPKITQFSNKISRTPSVQKGLRTSFKLSHMEVSNQGYLSSKVWPAGLRGFLYLLGLLWTFIGVAPWWHMAGQCWAILGISLCTWRVKQPSTLRHPGMRIQAIVADVFMSAIETITSKKKLLGVDMLGSGDRMAQQ